MAFWHGQNCLVFDRTATVAASGSLAVGMDMPSHAMSNKRYCEVDMCQHWAFAGGLCRKHAALKLLSSPNSPTGSTKPTPMQLYRKTVEMPSASRAHYDVVLQRIDRVLSGQVASGHHPPAAAVREAATLKADAALPPQPSQPLTRSAVARWV